MRARVIAAVVLGVLLAPASARAQKPFFDIRRGPAPEIQSTRPLTAPSSNRVSRALSFARAHAGALGLTAARVDALGAPARTTAGGIEQLRWRRSFHGIPAFDDELRVNLGADGAVLSASGASTAAAPPTLTPTLGAAKAMAVVTDDAGTRAAPHVASGPSGPRRDTTFTGGGRARLVVFGSRLAWRVDYPALPSAFYDTVVDASTGAILRRANLVRSDAPADVWDDHPGPPARRVDLMDLGYLPGSATTLQNDWIHAFSAADADDAAIDAGKQDVAVAGMPYAFSPVTGKAGCDVTTPCAWDPANRSSWQTNREQATVQAFYLANVFRAYLAGPPFGFDGFDSRRGDDALNLETEWGARSGQFDNSFMYTLPPGYVDPDGVSHSTLALSLFGVDPGFRAIDAADDASIVFHEYAHGFTNRTVHDAEGFEALDTAQAWAIDEASADFFAKSYLVDHHLETDTSAPGEVDMGDYTDATPHSIRAEPLDCPVSAPAAEPCPLGGLTYADFGHVIDRAEPHYDGEIWSETLWDLRNALGADLATQLVAGALALVAPQPSFLDMRDAILLADANLQRNDAAAIWQVFANRGMGCDASTDGSDDDAPHAGFDVPPCPQPTPTPVASPTATASPAATALPAVSPTPVATPTPLPPAQPSFVLKRSGRRGVAFTVTCRAACSVTGTLRVSRSVARKLHLSSRRVVGRLSAKLRTGGRRTYTVRLDARTRRAVKRRRVRSFKATLTAQAVYPGAVVAFEHRTVTVRR